MYTPSIFSGIGLGTSVHDIMNNGMNTCNLVGAITSIFGGLSGGKNIPLDRLHQAIQNLSPRAFAVYQGDSSSSIAIARPITIPMEVEFLAIAGNVFMFSSAGGRGNDSGESGVIEPHNLDNENYSYSIEDTDTTPQQGTRQTGINRAFALEAELIRKTGRGTYPWTESEIPECCLQGL